MTIEEAIKELKDASDSEIRYGDTYNHYYEIMMRIEAFDMAIKVLEQQPCGDCISRAKALEMLGDEPENWTDTEKEIQEINDYRWFKSILEELPSVTPTRPKGKWIDILDEKTELTETHHTECSICGADGWEEFKYCPKCGAKMELE